MKNWSWCGYGCWLHTCLLFAGLLLVSPCTAQDYYPVDDYSGKVLTTATGSVLIFNNFYASGLNIRVGFGRESVVPIDEGMVYSIDGIWVEFFYPLMDSSMTDSPTAILARTVKRDVQVNTDDMAPGVIGPYRIESVYLTGNPPAIMFYQPELKNPVNEVQRFMALYFMHGTTVMGLGVHLMPTESLKKAKARLITTASNLTFSPTIIAAPTP